MTMKRRCNGHQYDLDGCAKSIYDFPDVGKTWEIDGKRYCAINGYENDVGGGPCATYIMREIPDYIIENQIGEGSHGTVWLGRKKENNQIVCIKIAKPGFESALRHEFQILRSIKHQNIICPEVIFDENEKVCMVMPYYPDLTVERLLVGHNSEPQNLIIANVLYKSNVLESWGRGIALMVNECNRVGIPAPEFNTNGTAVWVTFRYTRTTVGPKHHPSTTQVPPKHHPSTTQVEETLSIIGNSVLSVIEMMDVLGLKNRKNFVKVYLKPSINEGCVAMLHPENPKHPKQKYFLTEKGKELLSQINQD